MEIQTTQSLKDVDFFLHGTRNILEKGFMLFKKKKLLVSNEGWSGMVGRLAAALDEVGVFIECGLEVTQIDGEKATLSDGREIEVDVIVLACGPAATRKLVRPLDAQQCDSVFSKLERTTASFIEVGLDSKPLLGKQAVVDGERRFAVLDYRAIQPRLGLEGSHLSAVAVGDWPETRGQLCIRLQTND